MQIKIVSKFFNIIKIAYHFQYNNKTRKKDIFCILSVDINFFQV